MCGHVHCCTTELVVDMATEDTAPLLSYPPRQDKLGPSSEYPEDKKGSNAIATFFNFSKASIGSGSFALPWAIRQAGVLLGSVGLVFLGVISVYTMQLMLDCKNYVARSLPAKERREVTFNDVGRAAFGFIGKFAVDLNVIFCNLGVCAGYIIFISSNLEWSTTCFANREHDPFTSWEVYGYVIPILIMLTFFPSFKYLAYGAYVGIVFLAVAMITVYVYGGSHPFLAISNDEVVYSNFSITKLPQFFGVAAYLFCVHSMVIPLESVMKKPSQMTNVLDAACLTVVVINLPFAIYGYLLFGNGVQGYCFENMPGGTFENIIRLTLSLELTLTFPIVFKPATEVVEEWIESSYKLLRRKLPPALVSFHDDDQLVSRVLRYCLVCAMRAVLVLLSWCVALLIPQFQLCVAFIGGLATTTLAFIMPPLFYMRLMWGQIPTAKIVLLTVILVFGVVATLITTGVNIDAIIEATNSPLSISC